MFSVENDTYVEFQHMVMYVETQHMVRLRIFIHRLVAIFQRRRLEREMEIEIRSHLEMQAEENVRNGMSDAEAARAAIRSFGGVDQTKERYRELRGLPAIEAVCQDVRYSLRSLSHNPGFALTAIVSIALAIGANSTIFSLADGLLLRPLPVPNASEVFTLRSLTPAVELRTGSEGRMSYPDFEDFRDSMQSFHDWILFTQVGAAIGRDARAPLQNSSGYLVNGDFLRALGVKPQIGRGFRPDEDQVPGRDAVVVLGHDLWKNEFGADPSVAGRRLRLNNVDFTIIGVAPESFTGMNPWDRPDFFIPVMMGPKVQASVEGLLTDRGLRTFLVKGRLKPGVSMESAAREAAAFAQSLEQSYPATNRGFSATVNTEMQMRFIDEPGLGVLVTGLFVPVVVILLVACANVANLTLSWARTRSREIAVRLAIGAGPRRLVRLLLVESLLIAVAGGVLAILVANFTLGLLSMLDPPTDTPIRLDFQLDERVVWFTAVLSLASVFLFGLAPALQATRADLVSALKDGAANPRRGRSLGRSALVVIQVAGSMALLVAATQGGRAFNDALKRNPGFRTDHRLTMRFDPGMAGYSPHQARQFYERLVERSLEVAGVKSAALASALPMTGQSDIQSIVPEGYALPPGSESVQVGSHTVDHHYFETFGVPIIAGRGFLETDRADSPRVAVVNERMAQEFFGSNPVGKRIRLKDQNGPVVEIVGVTVTGMYSAPIEPPLAFMYLPFSQNPVGRMALIVETYGDPAAVAEPLQERIRSIDPNLPIHRVLTMETVFESGFVHMFKVVGLLQAWISVLGLVLALIGLYALVSYQVAQQTREIGIRIALGAKRAQVIAMVLKRAAVMGLTGMGIGIVLSFAANSALRAVVGIPPFDPMLFVVVVLGMMLTNLFAAGIPARRASRIDPLRALRQE